jgi:signal transduction histidine kinase
VPASEGVLKLGTKLSIFLSFIIIAVLSGYGYFHIVSRRDILIRKMKVEVRGVGETLRVALEKISLPREMEYVQDLIDAVEESEKTVGVIVYHEGRNLVFRSRSLDQGTEPYLGLIKVSVRENSPEESFSDFKKRQIYAYTFPLRDKKGKSIGGVCILQDTAYMQDDVRKASWSIAITIFVLIGGTVMLVLWVMRRWIALPIAQLRTGIQDMAKGNLSTRIELKRRDELSELAGAFNQMAVDLNAAQERIVQEAESKLELERSLRRSEKLAAVGQISSGLAHEIGTPLNIISGRAELLKKKVANQAEVQKNLDTIIHQAERITKIIQQLLGFVRKRGAEERAVDLRVILGNTADLLDHQTSKQGIAVEKDFKSTLPFVKGDTDQLQQVFLNLILNAIQAMPQGGRLRLSASSKRCSRKGIEEDGREYLEVSIKDTGTGIEPEALQSLFTPFYSTKEKGTGLGLTVSLGIVQDHDGWIEVQSEIGKGSLFTVYLPLYEEFNVGPKI